MKNSKLFLKEKIERIPYAAGHWMAHVPFRWRLGNSYAQFRKLIRQSDNWSEEQKIEYTVNSFRMVFEYAKEKFPFYKELYRNAGVYDLKIDSLDDITHIPVITKKDIRAAFEQFDGTFLLNTGGTSGDPLRFYVDKNAFAREWAHMHRIWEKKDYKPTDLKITLRGKNLGNAPFVYNPVHNEFIINSYRPVQENIEHLKKLFRQRKICYVHGYPSSIYGFFKQLEPLLSESEKSIIAERIKACFLSSEFPAGYMVEYLKNNWGFDYISWYGHSEMCILAYDETKNNHYKSFITYGYAEEVGGRLIGTSFHNYDMPLIRYDTGDIIASNVCRNGLLTDFSITQGRDADFITDKKGLKIPLTALIFGRHHKLFEIADYIQVAQDKTGVVTFYVVTAKNYNMEEIRSAMDLSNLEIDFRFKILPEPIRTSAGKIKLKL